MCTRELDGREVEFGTTGYTMDDVFVLYDRTSESIWYPTSDQALEAVAGERLGQSIEILDEPTPEPLGKWLESHPSSLVLIPSAEDLERMRELRNRPYMGVRLGEREDGLFLEEVLEGGPAQKAGLEAGDQVLSMAGTKMNSRATLGEVVSEHAIGDTVEIVIARAARELTLSLTFGTRD